MVTVAMTDQDHRYFVENNRPSVEFSQKEQFLKETLRSKSEVHKLLNPVDVLE